MPIKTDRILSYLPGTFRALPRPTALYSLTDAFGSELQQAENSLAALMMAHWVDHADRGAEFICDLAGIAALYGLTPRGAPVAAGSAAGKTVAPQPVPADETVEEFREHLKRYVRTFLQGTATVQGILRVAAEALGLHIADGYADMDTWWTRPDETMVTTVGRGEDAATLLFGAESVTAAGQPARPAQVVGPELGSGADLTDASILRLKVDGGAAVQIDLPAQASLDEIVKSINAKAKQEVARRDGSHLVLTSPTAGPGSRLEVQEGNGDAAPRLLGLLPHAYHGAAATAVRLTGVVAPSSPMDMSGNRPRYLRMRVDGSLLAEVDCAMLAADSAKVTLDDVVQTINQTFDEAFGGPPAVPIASDDKGHLTLASPKVGFASSIELQPPAAQDATEQLFGPMLRFHMGRDAAPAVVIGVRDLSQGVDLSTYSKVRVKVDERPPVTVDCAGPDPAHTGLIEIVAALDSTLGRGVASQDGRFLRLASLKTGSKALLSFESLPEDEDATELLLGIGPRVFNGGAATPATVVGTRDLSEGANIWACHVVQVAVDDGAPVEVDVRAQAADPAKATLDEMTAAFDTALGATLASHDGKYLTLRSPTVGGTSSLAIEPLEETRRQRFITRAFITDEAGLRIFGFVQKQAWGSEARRAQVVGKKDLSRGVDVRARRFLRFSVDGRPACEVDLAASGRIPRPRAALLKEIVDAIEDVKAGVASHDGQYLILTSEKAGKGGSIVFDVPQGADALYTLLSLEPGTYRGRAAIGVRFQGVVDLSTGVDLPAHAAIAVGVDAGQVVEVALTSDEPAHKTLSEIAFAINVKLGNIFARGEGNLLSIVSTLTGTESRVEFGVPGGSDVTEQLFGIKPPRCYRGAVAEPAEVIGKPDLSGGSDLRVARFLRLAVDGLDASVDCAAQAADPTNVSLEEIVKAINESRMGEVASSQGGRLALRSSNPGGASRIELLPYTDPEADARLALLGEAPEFAQAHEPAPAVIEGQVDMLGPVNLAERRLLRLAVDGGRPVDVDVVGAAPEKTMLDEIVAKINAVIPGLASATEDDRLRLTSPTTGEDSRLELLPVRTLDLLEYPPEAVADPPEAQPARQVRPGDRWPVENNGACETYLEVELAAPHGSLGPELINLTLGRWIRLRTVVRPDQSVRLWYDPAAGLRAKIKSSDGMSWDMPDSQIVAGLLGGDAQASARVDALMLPRGRSDWMFLDCHAARFDRERFNSAKFVDVEDPCRARGIFDVSRFSNVSPGSEMATYAGPATDPPVDTRFRWSCYRTGAFVVNLPLDLPEPFGARFNQARFGQVGDKPEEYLGVVVESRPGVKPEDDPDHLIGRLKQRPSILIQATWVERVPIGWTASAIPFRGPRVRKFGGGTETEPSRLYLHDPGASGYVELRAREPGSWGNALAVTVRKSGAARYDVTCSFVGGRFENARQVALGGRNLKPGEDPLSALTQHLLKPGPVGVLHAKAAGIDASVKRE